MEYFTTAGDAARQATDCAIVGVYAQDKLDEAAAEIDEAGDGVLRRLASDGDLPTQPGKAVLLPAIPGVQAGRVIVAGLGKPGRFGPVEYRKALDASLKLLAQTGAADALCWLARGEIHDTGPYYRGRHAAQAVGDALYRFGPYKSRRRKAPKLKKFGLGLAGDAEREEAQDGMSDGQAIVRGMDLTRDLGNAPPNVCTPGYLVTRARDLARRYSKISVEVLDEPDMQRLGMGALLSVARGSEVPGHLIVLSYDGAGDDEAPVALVGKGITFDTGGISIKPSQAMDEMKYDMGGAAAVLGALLSAAALELPLNLKVLVPTAENMPSGRASRPGDIVTSLSGQTVEILNTDAEGRLILCDALTYAQREFEPRAMIDVATLTGACVIALGHHHTGLMANDDALAGALLAAGERSRDRAWRLPLGEDYARQLKSNFADMANVGGREAGAITAGAFLAKFTEDSRWAHLDVAGTAWRSGNSNKGSTGRPVPLLVDYLLHEARGSG